MPHVLVLQCPEQSRIHVLKGFYVVAREDSRHTLNQEKSYGMIGRAMENQQGRVRGWGQGQEESWLGAAWRPDAVTVCTPRYRAFPHDDVQPRAQVPHSTTQAHMLNIQCPLHSYKSYIHYVHGKHAPD